MCFIGKQNTAFRDLEYFKFTFLRFKNNKNHLLQTNLNCKGCYVLCMLGLAALPEILLHFALVLHNIVFTY